MPHGSESDDIRRATRIVGVYNAHGTLLGELNYLLQRTFAGKHCALCDITHSSVRRRPEWDRCSRNFTQGHDVTIELLHLDEIPSELAQIPDFTAPGVYVQETNGPFTLVLGPQDLELCGHSPEQFFELLESKIR